jgi:putative ABC transport system ATP-binding protein
VLELEHVHKRYVGPDGKSVSAVNDVSLTVASGELIALYGPSGSGKSTLLLLAAGMARPDAGSVRFDGRELARLSRRSAARFRRTELGFVFQVPRLVAGMTAIDNAALKVMGRGLSQTDARRRVLPLLERLEIDHRAEQRVAQLSHGERQRVALARALANGPRLVLADEPTGSLDSRRSREVLELLAEVCRERGVGVLLVTHDPAATTFADRVHSLHDGELLPHLPEEPSGRASAR